MRGAQHGTDRHCLQHHAVLPCAGAKGEKGVPAGLLSAFLQPEFTQLLSVQGWLSVVFSRDWGREEQG